MQGGKTKRGNVPYRPKKPCRHFGCGQLTEKSYCPNHKAIYYEKFQKRLKAQRERFDKTRPSSRKRGYSSRWDKASRNFLHFNPLCAKCDSVGITTAAKEVDHIKPHKGDMELFWNADNWQPLCKSCHSKKTRRESRGRRAG